GFTSDDTPLSSATQSVTFQLYKNGVLLTTTTQNTSGVYTFGNLDYGTYYVQEVVPTSWVQTANRGAATHGTSANGSVTVSSGGSSAGNDFDDALVTTGSGVDGTIGFWTNKNGEAALTGSSSGQKLLSQYQALFTGALVNPDKPGYTLLVDATGAY